LLRLTNSSEQPTSTRTIFIEDVLQRISSTRVLDRLREEASLDYNPAVYSIVQDREKVTDWFFEAQVDPKAVSKVEQVFDETIDELLGNITQDELDTAVKQLVLDMSELADLPGDRGWAYTRYLIQGYDIDVLSDVEHMATSLTLEEVMNQARHSFGKGAKRSTIILNPKS
jgi:zinc protease